jgi:hypothetical protein
MAGIIGVKANSINDRLRILQDYVAIAVVPDTSTIKLLNVGKTNLYLWGFDMVGNTHHFDRPRLIPAGTNDSAYYYIGTPNITQVKDNKFDFKLYLTDQFENKWITNAGGDVTKTKVINEGKEVDAYLLKVWTYDTTKKDWEFK